MAEQPGATNHNPTNSGTADQPGPDGSWEDGQGVTSRLMSQEGVFQLTQDLRKFSDTLTSLKVVFCEEKESLEQSLRVVAHERLGELLKVLKTIVNKYQELNSTGILNAAENLINHIKNFNYESVEETVPPEIFSAINNLALAFSSSVSECLIGDINISPRQLTGVTQPYENVPPHQPAGGGYQRHSMYDGMPEIAPINSVADGVPSEAAVPDVLDHVTENLDISFERAKAWSKYANDLLKYVKNKAHIEMEYAKNLTKLSQTTRAILSEQSFLPFQSLYCTALDNDKEYASNVSSVYQNMIMAHKFIEPLQARRLEHDRQLKAFREAWRKDKRRLEEAETNLKKAKQQYQTRNQDYQKAKDAAIRADQQQYINSLGDGSHSRQGSGTSSSQLAHNVAAGATLGIIPTTKAEKKKKEENEMYLKAMQAEQYYRACVNEANQRRRELEKKEEDYLKKLRDLMTQCDQTTKAVTLNFFSLHCELASPVLVQYQALLEESKSYEPGFQYAEYLRHVTPHHHVEERPYHQFESCNTEGAAYMEQSAATQRDLIHGESSPLPGRASLSGRLQARRTSQRGFSDTESSSSRSLDDISPSASPGDSTNRKDIHKRRPSTEGSLSSEEILDDAKDTDPARLTAPQQFKDFASYSPDSTPAPIRPQFQVPKITKMVANVKEALKGMKRNPKSTIFGVDFSVAAQDNVDGIPLLIKKCIAEIDNRALTVKGIYRVNGVKNRVEKLCALLDSPQCARVDLVEQLPHDVSGVLKYFLRQLPEPLLLHRLYEEFLELGKEYTEIMKQKKPPDPVPEAGESNNIEAEGDAAKPPSELQEPDLALKLAPVLEKSRSVVDKLPTANRNTLQYIVAHLSRVVEHQSQNMMTASNLAIIFGPTLLRPTPSNESGHELQSLIELPSQSRAIEMLISHRNKIFETYSQKAQNEDLQDQIKTQSSIDVPDEIQIVNHEPDPPTAPQMPKLLPLNSEPASAVPISNENAPASSDEAAMPSDNHSTSGTSSSGELYLADEGSNSRFGQKDSISGDSSQIGQSNGGMNVIDDGRTVLPHCPGLRKSSSSRDVQGGFLSAVLDGRHLVHDDISVGPSSRAAPSTGTQYAGNATASGGLVGIAPLHARSRPIATDKAYAATTGHTSSTSESQQRNRNPSGDAGVTLDPASDLPIAPIRVKTKRRSLERNKPPTDLPIPEGQPIHQSPATTPVSPHRPRSRRISGFMSRSSQEKINIGEHDSSDPRRASVEVQQKPAASKLKRHSAVSNILNSVGYKSDTSSKLNTSSTGRKLPQVPTQPPKTAKPSSPVRSKQISMPGRTPPFNKTQAWSFAKGDVEIDAPARDSKSHGIQRKILMDDLEGEDVSFC